MLVESHLRRVVGIPRGGGAQVRRGRLTSFIHVQVQTQSESGSVRLHHKRNRSDSRRRLSGVYVAALDIRRISP